jgi:hypothetical protein
LASSSGNISSSFIDIVGGFIVFSFLQSVVRQEGSFEKPLSRIWFRAFVDELIISLIMTVLLFAPILAEDLDIFRSGEFWIGFFGQS